MKDILKVASTGFFYLMALAVFLWTSSLTLALVARLLPNDNYTPYFALFLLDIGALIWLLAFMFAARGIVQRAIALGLMIADLLGIVFSTVAELYLGGQQLTTVPAWIGEYVVPFLGLMTILNLVAMYAYHVADPAISQAITMGVTKDKIEREAVRQVEANLGDNAAILAQQIAARMRTSVLAELNIVSPQVIDVQPVARQLPTQNAIPMPPPAEPQASDDFLPTPPA